MGTGEAVWSWIAPGRTALLAMSRTAVSGVGLAVHADGSADGSSDAGSGDEAVDCTVTAVGVEDGTALWSVPFDLSGGSWSRSPLEYHLRGAVAVAPNRAVLLTDGLQAYALNSGRPVWPPTAVSAAGDVQLSVCRDGIIQIGLDDGHLTVRCLDAAEGTIRWETAPSTRGPVDTVHVLQEDPLAVLCRGRGSGGLEEVLVLDAEDGRTAGRIPVSEHGELRITAYGPVDGLHVGERVASVGELLVAVVRPAELCGDDLTAFALDGGAPHWTRRSQGLVVNVFAVDGDVVVVSRPNGLVRVHLLDGATGAVLAVRRLAGYEAGMRGRYYLDAHHRLVHVSPWGDGKWHPLQMFPLR
ncbi:outer membrane protein assembly factor BamB family protein [Streptomyces sp. RKAG337]|uniref:outer membrane protein assembly factor BamB family protein n=1 Tax=Streptomyces sp. RKAG337 TaxID=2893404 RepID=UPI0020347E38|nr:PQQ-binding-like beta-propeller repeat protein [Streptomyces sp. RKAG337]MCM2424857.1 PQQ-like beta-propeller repeat protein [Streptomyces sp. RKAG337]